MITLTRESSKELAATCGVDSNIRRDLVNGKLEFQFHSLSLVKLSRLIAFLGIEPDFFFGPVSGQVTQTPLFRAKSLFSAIFQEK